MAAISVPSSECWHRLPENDAMLNFNREIIKFGIARRLIVYVVLFSSLITLLTTAMQLYRDYDNDINLIEDQLRQVQDVHLKALTATLWASDIKELRTHLEGISHLRDMQFLEVRDQEKVWVSLGIPQSENMISRQYPMIHPHRGRDIEIGTLTVVASLTGVYQRLIDKVWVILVSNGIKTFLVAGFILIIFHTLITRHLIRIAGFAQTLDINSLDKQLDLDRKGYRKQKTDELDLVVNAINQMQVNIKESFAALEQSEEHFQVLAKVAPVGIFNTDAQGNCIYTNECWRDLAGMSEEEALGEGWARALHPEDRDRVFTEWCQAVADKIPFKTECRFQRPDGKVSWLLALAEAELDAEGQVVGYVGTITDVSERKQIEVALQESESLLEKAQQLAQIGHWKLNPAIGEVQGSDELFRIFGFPREGVTFDSFVEIVHPDDREMDVAAIQRGAEHGENWDIEHRLICRDGKEKWVRAIGEAITDETGKVVELIGTVQDITKLKQTETELIKHRDHLEELVAERTTALERANKELESFSYSVSHDLRAPLRAIDGFSLAVLEDYADKLDAEGRDHLQRVRRGAQRMSELIDDMLQLSRVTRHEIRRNAVDLSALASVVLGRLEKSEPDRKVEQVIATGVNVKGDSHLLEIVLANLLGNAWKYTGKTADSRIEFGVVEQEGESVYFVKDNGTGFDMKYADKLFGAFQRLHQEEDFPGTGIGLATVQRIIHRHGGRIWAKAEVNKGATFYFTLAGKE